MGPICHFPVLPLSQNVHIAFGQELARRYEFSGIAAEEAKVDVDTPKDSPSVLVCLGAYLEFASVCDGMRVNGIKFSITPPGVAAVKHFHALGVADLLGAGTAVKAAIKGAMAAGYSLYTAIPKPEPQADGKPEPAAPPVPAPQEIRIISMPPVAIASLPERTIETTINRDDNDDMTGSTAVETDRAKA